MSDNQKPIVPKAHKPAPKGPGKPTKADAQPTPRKDHQLQSLQEYAGTVGTFGATPDGVYDRFTLEAADRSRTVKFPPHFGQELRALAQPGHAVSVLGFVHTTPKGDEHLHLARLDAAGGSARPLPPGPPTPPSAADAVTVSGAVAELLLDPKGRLHGLRLTGTGPVLRFPPPVGEQFAERLTVGTALEASGLRRLARPGEVWATDAQPPVQVDLLTVGSESFLVR